MTVSPSSPMQQKKARSTATWRVVAVLSALAIPFAWLSACGSSGNSGGNSTDNTSSNSSGGSSGSGSGGSSGGSGGGSGGSSGGKSSSSGGSGGASNSGSGGTSSGSGSGGSSGGGSGSSGASSGSGSGGSSGGGSGSSSGARDAGGDGTVPPGGDGGPPACTNTDPTQINIDSSGWVCNNMWNIQGAWYCFADTAGSASATSCPGGTAGVGVIPYNTTSKAMCLSGTTVGSMPSSTAFGAAIGMELGHQIRDAGKGSYNATTQHIVGFAITISGDTGGANLNINFPPAQTTAGEAPGVAVPGLASGSSPMTYNVLFADAIMSDNTAAPIPKVVDATNVTDVQVKIDVDGIAHPYNFCITKVVPITAAPAAPGSLGNYGPTFNEGKQIVLTGLGAYGIQNDPFNVGSDPMTMQAKFGGGQVGFIATPAFNSGGSTPGAFPSIAYGWIHGGNFVGGGGGGYAGGKTINGTNKLASVTSSWTFTPGGGNWDAAYDCWFGGNSNSINPASELMVWVAHNGVNPLGGQNTAVTVANATGSWTQSTGTNSTNQPVVSYVSTANMMSVTNFNLLPFFLDAANTGKAGLSGGSFWLGCQAGFELYNTGTWTTGSYSMTAQ